MTRIWYKKLSLIFQNQSLEKRQSIWKRKSLPLLWFSNRKTAELEIDQEDRTVLMIELIDILIRIIRDISEMTREIPRESNMKTKKKITVVFKTIKIIMGTAPVVIPIIKVAVKTTKAIKKIKKEK